MSYAANCNTLDAYIAPACDFRPITGKVTHVALVPRNVTLAWSTAADWLARIGTGPNDIRIIKLTSGGKPAAEPNKIEGFGESPEMIAGRVHTLTGRDMNYVQNRGFYNDLRVLTGYRVVYRTRDGGIWIVNDECSFDAEPIIPEASNEAIHAQITVKWTSIDDPQYAVQPTGVFN